MTPSDDRIFAYLADELSLAERTAFETDLAREPALRQALDEWSTLAQANQLAYNERRRGVRHAEFLDALNALPRQSPTAAPRATRPRWLSWILGAPTGARRSPLLPMGWGFAALFAAIIAWPPPQDDFATTRGAAATCVQWSVDLPDGLDAATLRAVLTQYDVRLANGPDAAGHFALAAPRESTIREAIQALGATAIEALPAGACPVRTR